MAQADLIVRLIKSVSNSDQTEFQKVAEDLIAEEKRKGHRILAERMFKALRPPYNGSRSSTQLQNTQTDVFFETTPERGLSSLFMSSTDESLILELIEEQHRSELLHSHNLKARHRLLLTGPPGNGKTTLAEALAHELMYPLIVIRYESLIGSYLGETSSRIKNVLDYAKTQRCVLFFDEFETLAKERGDTRETGEIKRIVSSLLLQTDALPDYVVLVAASNHPELLDRAVWRRFQVKIELPPPSRRQLSVFISHLSAQCEIEFGYSSETLAKALLGSSFSEAEQFCLDIARRVVLSRHSTNPKRITENKLKQWRSQQISTVSGDSNNG